MTQPHKVEQTNLLTSIMVYSFVYPQSGTDQINSGMSTHEKVILVLPHSNHGRYWQHIFKFENMSRILKRMKNVT